MPLTPLAHHALTLCVQRMDLGECLKVHDLALRADYEIASKHQEYFFELDVSLLSGCCGWSVSICHFVVMFKK